MNSWCLSWVALQPVIARVSLIKSFFCGYTGQTRCGSVGHSTGWPLAVSITGSLSWCCESCDATAWAAAGLRSCHRRAFNSPREVSSATQDWEWAWVTSCSKNLPWSKSLPVFRTVNLYDSLQHRQRGVCCEWMINFTLSLGRHSSKQELHILDCRLFHDIV